jgi:hypothetical protein
MIDFKNVGMTKDLTWFAKRYNALIIEFPEDITPDILEQNHICSSYDLEDAYKALKSAHSFLTSISAEMFLMSKQNEKKMELLEKVFSKIDLFWALGLYGDLYEEENEYNFAFKKPLISKGKYLPSSYIKSLNNVSENGCWIEYFKNDKEVNDYKSCDRGVLHFDDRLTALGIYLFVRQINYDVKLYYRIDMRSFIKSGSEKNDILELLSGYSDSTKKYFLRISNYIKENYTDCLPQIGYWDYINCTINFMVSPKKRVLAGIGIGSKEDYFEFFCSHNGKETEMILREVDFTGIKRDSGLDYSFIIENETDIKRAIHIMDIKYKYGKNVKLNKNA